MLYGLSAGGMLTYHVAALNKTVAAIVGMTFLDQREQQVREETNLNLLISRVGIPLTVLAARTPLRRLRMPMTLASKMLTLVNVPAALKVCLADRTSASKWVTLAFLASYTKCVPIMEPEAFDVCPILLTQPARDRWTPLHLAEIFLKRIRRVPMRKVTLENAGYYPREQPGLSQMVNAIQEFGTMSAASARVRRDRSTANAAARLAKPVRRLDLGRMPFSPPWTVRLNG